jgi:hypothetical protein
MDRDPPLRRYAGPRLRWASTELQIAAIVFVAAALIALFAFDLNWLFWVLVAASLALAAIDWRLGR